MYQIVKISDNISVPPVKFKMDLEESIKESIEEKFEGKIDSQIGIVLAVVNIDELGEGKVVPGDGSIHYTTKFNLLSWMPKDHEIVEGEVVDITEFGAFIRVGALDGLVHISQIMDDYVSYDEKNGILAGKESKKILKNGDIVRARIISISLKEQNKLNLTMRQPYLGAIHWEEAKKDFPGKKENAKEMKKNQKKKAEKGKE